MSKENGISPCPIGSMEPHDDELHSLGKSMRWLGDDGHNVFIEVQGQLVIVSVRKGPKMYPSAKRGKCLPFSSASRLRLLRLVNRLEWANAGRSSFVTLTYTDRTGRPECGDITYHRSRFQEWFEAECGGPTCGLWRVEWKKRLTGRFLGEPMPHIHVISFNCRWVSKWKVKEKWMKIIGERENASTDIKGIKDIRHCMHYVGKYIGKMPDADSFGSLGIGAYLNSGRAWGTYRKELLPLADKTYVRLPLGTLTKRIRAIARAAWKGVAETEESGYTLFGPAAEHVQRLLNEYACRSVETGVGYMQPLGRSSP